MLAKLKVLAEEAADCSDCQLHLDRIKPVFARGNSAASLIFLGEAPGKDEAELGSPFVGRAGKLLDKMIEAMGLTQDQVYITNTVLCRPPNNRKPTPEEIEACNRFRTPHLKLINPKVIVALGATAIEALLGSGLGVLKRHGQIETWKGMKVVPTFHPAALLRNPGWKELAKQDLKKVLEILNEI